MRTFVCETCGMEFQSKRKNRFCCVEHSTSRSKEYVKEYYDNFTKKRLGIGEATLERERLNDQKKDRYREYINKQYTVRQIGKKEGVSGEAAHQFIMKHGLKEEYHKMLNKKIDEKLKKKEKDSYCEKCGVKKKDNKSRYCVDCRYVGKKMLCVRCGKEIGGDSGRGKTKGLCDSCYHFLREKEDMRICDVCGQSRGNHVYGVCRRCAGKLIRWWIDGVDVSKKAMTDKEREIYEKISKNWSKRKDGICKVCGMKGKIVAHGVCGRCYQFASAAIARGGFSNCGFREITEAKKAFYEELKQIRSQKKRNGERWQRYEC